VELWAARNRAVHTAAVSSTISGRQIFELPFATRNAVELSVTQPGVSTQ